MTETIEVTAEVLEENTLAEVGAFDLEEVKGLVLSINSELRKCKTDLDAHMRDSDEIARLDDKSLEESKKLTSKAIKEANAARIAFKKKWNEPVTRVEEIFKSEISALEELHGEYDGEFKRRQEAAKQAKWQTLNDHFYEYCSDNGFRALTESVTFERILKGNWLNKTYSLKKAKEEIEATVNEIMQAWRTLGNHELFDRDGTMLEFFSTLSLTEALNYDTKRRADQERLDALRAEQGEVQEYRSADPAAEAPEPDPVPLEVYEPVHAQPFGVEVEPEFHWEVSVFCSRTRLYQLREIMIQMGLDPHARKVVM